MNFLYKSILLLLFLSESLSHNAQTEKNIIEQNKKTFLVKTKLTKEQLETLLQEGKTEVINLKIKNKDSKGNNGNNTLVDGDDISTEEGLHREIQDELRDDALNPLEEFHIKEVKTSETKTFISKNDIKILDSLYEKKFGKIYAYLTLIFFVFAMIYFNKLISNKNDCKNKNINYYEFDSSEEHMLAEFD